MGGLFARQGYPFRNDSTTEEYDEIERGAVWEDYRIQREDKRALSRCSNACVRIIKILTLWSVWGPKGQKVFHHKSKSFSCVSVPGSIPGGPTKKPWRWRDARHVNNNFSRFSGFKMPDCILRREPEQGFWNGGNGLDVFFMIFRRLRGSIPRPPQKMLW